jgi:hypothetical protein
MPEPHVANFMQMHKGSKVSRHVNHSLVMQLVAFFAHADDHHAATSPAYLVFTSTLAFVQLRPKILAALIQVESTPSSIEAQVP